MNIQREFFTAEKAKRLLENGGPVVNAGLRSSTQKAAILSDMEAGRFRSETNGQTLVIERGTGHLYDGMHRMTALAETGLGFWFLVQYVEDGLAELPTINSGGARTPGHILKYLGHPSANGVGAAAALYYRVAKGPLFSGEPVMISVFEPSLGPTLTKAELPEWVRQNPEIGDAVTWASNRVWPKGFRGRSLVVARIIFDILDKEDCERFMESLRLGTGLEKGDPVLLLREWFIAACTGRRREPEILKLAMLFKSWSHWRAGKRLKYLRVRVNGPARESWVVPR